MLQDSVPAGSYDDPFLSSVCVLFATAYFSTIGCSGYFFLLGCNMIHAHSVPKMVLGYRCPFPRASLVMCRETNWISEAKRKKIAPPQGLPPASSQFEVSPSKKRKWYECWMPQKRPPEITVCRNMQLGGKVSSKKEAERNDVTIAKIPRVSHAES